MKPCLSRLFTLVFALVVAGATAAAKAADPLPSWKDNGTKDAIMEFVARVTKEGGPDYIPPQQRIATFDNDGTLWAEKPIYFQLIYAMDKVEEMAPRHPEWKDQEPFASILKGDPKKALEGGKPALMQIIAATHTGMSGEEFKASASEWLGTARHPKTRQPYTDMVYQPMLELLRHLRANGFKTFIVSGGGVDFIRVFSEEVYGIPPEQVVGSSLKAEYQSREGKPALVKLPEINLVDDKAGKPVGIYQYIGRRPVFSVGNSDGDLQMLEYATAGEGPRFGLLLHHTDSRREWAYDRDSDVGRLDKGLKLAQDKGWTVIDMQNDWRTVFPFEKK